VASWWIARAVLPEHTAGLEGQAWNHVDEAVRRTGPVERWSKAGDGHDLPRGFVWGRSSPADLPATIGFLVDLSRSIPDDVRGHPELRAQWEMEGLPWVAPSLAALALACVALARRPWRLAALLCSTVPFLALLSNTVHTLPQLRYLATGMIAMPVLLGVGVAALAQARIRRRPVDDERARRVPWRPLGALTALALLVIADVTHIGGDHDTRQTRDLTQSEPRQTIERVLAGEARSTCEHALRTDLEAGHPVETRLYASP